jgi:hypothetical protein
LNYQFMPTFLTHKKLSITGNFRIAVTMIFYRFFLILIFNYAL